MIYEDVVAEYTRVLIDIIETQWSNLSLRSDLTDEKHIHIKQLYEKTLLNYKSGMANADILLFHIQRLIDCDET